MKPKTFISYSWTSQSHQNQIIEWAERLVADGVDVILDVFDLKEGQDKYTFMERMVTDPSVTHVLVICDKTYSEKADARKAGVGTESQIISKEVYDKVEQSKFIPVIAEVDMNGEPYLPTFFKTRIWIDFSSPENVNENWERLIRLLYGKPLHEKPTLGKPPVYITDDNSSPASPARGKYESLKQAILKEKRGVANYRRDFLDACISYADSLRVRERPNLDTLPQKVLEDSEKLLPVRDHIVDWVLLESEAAPSNSFSEALIDALEKLRALKDRPPEVTTWNDAWFEAHNLFVYQTFLYIVAALLKTGAYADLNNIYTSHLILPESERRGGNNFGRFDDFYAHSELLNSILAPEGRKLNSPAAELVKRQATRSDISFVNVIEADLLTLLMAFITPDTRWYPQLMHYSGFSREFPFFLRATQHKHYLKLATVTGVDSADALREAVKSGHERLRANEWHNFHFNRNFWESMNMDRLDTIK
jgi:hypothetical protein